MMKICIVTLSFCLILFFPFSVYASEQPTHLSTNRYTQENVHYVVQETSYIRLAANSIFGSREVTYDGRVIPSRQIYWQERIGDTSYSGTLTLKKSTFSAATQKTTTTYEGTLTAISGEEIFSPHTASAFGIRRFKA